LNNDEWKQHAKQEEHERENKLLHIENGQIFQNHH